MGYQRIFAKIDLNAIEKNVAGVRSRIPTDTKIMAVIKADAYGHGAVTLAHFLEDQVNWFGVATADEALELREHGCNKSILIFRIRSPGGISKSGGEKHHCGNLSVYGCRKTVRYGIAAGKNGGNTYRHRYGYVQNRISGKYGDGRRNPKNRTFAGIANYWHIQPFLCRGLPR